MFGLAASVLLSLLPQIGEQVDYLRFLPDKTSQNRLGWWTAVIGTGPGWVLLGGFKLLVGSFLAVWLVRQGVHPTQADEPTIMYHHAFRDVFQSPTFALVLTGVFVIVCQLKINVTNAYAGSIAWSNFFSRLTHSHPGRVVWLVFNVVLALILMEIGIFRAIESILVIYANFAAGWIGALTADLVINKPLGYSPEVHRVQARAPVRHQSRGCGRAGHLRAAVQLRVHGRVRPVRGDPLALRRAVHGLHRRPAHRHLHARQVLPGAPRHRPARQGDRARMQHLRERLRARRHRHVPGVLRPHLLVVLHARGTLPRSVQDQQPFQ